MLKETAEKLNNQAIMLASHGDYPEAIACFIRAITIENDNALLWFNLGITCRDAGPRSGTLQDKQFLGVPFRHGVVQRTSYVLAPHTLEIVWHIILGNKQCVPVLDNTSAPSVELTVAKILRELVLLRPFVRRVRVYKRVFRYFKLLVVAASEIDTFEKRNLKKLLA